jgi:hypothetical protein
MVPRNEPKDGESRRRNHPRASASRLGGETNPSPIPMPLPPARTNPTTQATRARRAIMTLRVTAPHENGRGRSSHSCNRAAPIFITTQRPRRPAPNEPDRPRDPARNEPNDPGDPARNEPKLARRHPEKTNPSSAAFPRSLIDRGPAIIRPRRCRAAQTLSHTFTRERGRLTHNSAAGSVFARS